MSEWIGVVENIDDPLKVGRIKVRIINCDTEDLNLLPTEDLPWALVAFSPDGFRHTTLRLEDWVIGYFADGKENAQVRIVTGVLPGIREIEPSTTVGFSRQLTPTQVSQRPTVANVIAVDRIGEPTTPRLGRGVIEGTTIGVSNKNRVHICDISNEMSRAASWVKLKFSEFMTFIRNAIRAILKTLGFTPDGTSARLQELAKNLTAEAKRIRRFLKTINDAVEVFNNFVKQVNQMIQYLLSLPQKVLALLSDCLSRLYNSLSKGFSELFSDSTGTSSFSELSEAAREIQKTFTAAVETAGNVASAAAGASATVAAVGTTSKNFKI